MSRSVIAFVVLLIANAGATASLSNLVSAWGHDFVVTPFEMKEMMVAVATEKRTGEKFNIVKMPGGQMMAIVPFDQMTVMPKIDPAGMMK